MSAECDEKFDKSELIKGGGNIPYMRVVTKLLSKNITKQLFLFCLLKEATLPFLTDDVDIFFSSVSQSQFRSINKYILCCTQHRK